MSAIAWDIYPKDVFRWVSFGTTATPSTATVKRPHWQAHGLSAFNDVYVWESKGSAGSAPSTIPMGGSGYPATVNWQGKRKRATLAERPNEHLRQILDRAVAEYYGEIVNADLPKSVKTEAANLVKPFADKAARYKALPKPAEVNWAALERDANAVAALLGLWSAELAAKVALDDDDDFLLMVLH